MGRGAWIAVVVLGFWLWWPAGLALLGYLAFGRHRAGMAIGPGRWHNMAAGGTARAAGPPWGWSGFGGCRSGLAQAAAPSGNRAFDDYRAATLQRLEDEQREFVDYLERLRQARDKSEFDAYMAERRSRETPQPPAEPA